MTEVFIPKDLKSGNAFTNMRGRASFWTYKNYRDDWYKTMSYYFIQQERKKVKAFCEIVRVMKPMARPFDAANLAHGAKPIPDFLKGCGWIWDDNPNWFECEYKQVKQKDTKLKDSGTIIRIWYEARKA